MPVRRRAISDRAVVPNIDYAVREDRPFQFSHRKRGIQRLDRFRPLDEAARLAGVPALTWKQLNHLVARLFAAALILVVESVHGLAERSRADGGAKSLVTGPAGLIARWVGEEIA